MKKLLYLLLALMMCLSLTACGGPDKKAATDAFNKASNAFNEVSAIMNENPEAYGDFFDDMISYAEMLNQIGEQLKGDNLDQGTLDELAEWCGEVEQWAIDAKAAIGE